MADDFFRKTLDDEDHTSKLPPELLLQIFNLIPAYHLRRSVCLVNKRWHRISRDPTLLRVLNVSKKTPSHIIKEYINQRMLLNVLKSSGLECINETIDTIVVSCQFIRCLDIGFCEIRLETILTISKHAHNLRHINLEGVVLSQEMVDILVTNLPYIEVLNLSHCCQLTDLSVCVISEKLKRLIKLNIDGIQSVTDYSVKTLCDNHSKSLDSLWLDGCELSSECFQVLTHCKCLTLLSLSYAESLSDDAVLPLRTLCHLKSLTIRKATQITKTAMLSLFDHEKSNLNQLTMLDLNECLSIDDDVIESICQLCGISLRILSLHWCWSITDIGIENLVNCCRNIERLSLLGNHIIKGQSFVNIIEKWPKLRLLNLTNCNHIDDELMHKVAQKIPLVYIFDYFGERFGDRQDDVTQYDITRIFDKMPICDDI